MALKEMGEENPYPESKNAANDKIEPTADIFKGNLPQVNPETTHIGKVKQLRSDLTELAEELADNKIELHNFELHRYIVKSKDYITESNMWLGMELGRIHKFETEK